jgi:hypothetical protein
MVFSAEFRVVPLATRLASGFVCFRIRSHARSKGLLCSPTLRASYVPIQRGLATPQATGKKPYSNVAQLDYDSMTRESFIAACNTDDLAQSLLVVKT